MKRGFTLIELIFTIVIMAGVFMVIPKILMIANKNDSFAMKQDAYLNAISLTKLASSLAWDENNTESISILHTSLNDVDCNSSTHYIRKGSFLAAHGRTCHDNLLASMIGSDAGEDDYQLFDDIDDFNNTQINTTAEGSNLYKIETSVGYITPTLTTTGKDLTIDLYNATDTTASSNLKKLTTTIKYNGKKAVKHGQSIATFSYISANIGQFTLGKREW